MAVPVLGFVAMSVDFLSDQEAAAFGRYGGVPSGVELERFFFLDDEDRALVARHRGDHNRLGFGVQLTTVRYLGRFLADPLDGVPVEVVDYLAEQLEVADPSCLKRYAQRAETHREHVGEIRRALGLRDFAAVAGQLRGWVDKWAWVSGDGPKAIFAGAVSWLRERGVLLPGVSTLTLLVSEVRAEVTRRLWRTLYEALTHEQRAAMDALLEVAPGERVSQLQRWRTGSARCSGPEMVKALHRVAEILGSGLSRVQVDATVSPRRLRELASYGMGTDVTQLRRHRDPRRLATMVATVAHLETAATDDALELLDLLMVTELIGKARRENDKRTLSGAPQLARASAPLAVFAHILLEAQSLGIEDHIPVAWVWEAIEARFPRAQVQADAATVAGQISPVQPADGQWRSELAGRRIATVSGFVKTLTATITFGATGEGAPVLAAMRDLGEQLASSAQWSVRNPRIHAQVVPGPWKHLVFGRPADPRGEIDKNAYTYCVLEAFHRYLRRREIYAPASTRWRDPRAHLLEGEQWEVVRDDVLTVLDLPADPDALLAQHVQTLEEAYIYVGVGGQVQHGQHVVADYLPLLAFQKMGPRVAPAGGSRGVDLPAPQVAVEGLQHAVGVGVLVDLASRVGGVAEHQVLPRAGHDLGVDAGVAHTPLGRRGQLLAQVPHRGQHRGALPGGTERDRGSECLDEPRDGRDPPPGQLRTPLTVGGLHRRDLFGHRRRVRLDLCAREPRLDRLPHSRDRDLVLAAPGLGLQQDLGHHRQGRRGPGQLRGPAQRALVGLAPGLADQLGDHQQVQQLQGVIGCGGLQMRDRGHHRRQPARIAVAPQLGDIGAHPVAGQLTQAPRGDRRVHLHPRQARP